MNRGYLRENSIQNCMDGCMPKGMIIMIKLRRGGKKRKKVGGGAVEEKFKWENLIAGTTWKWWKFSTNTDEVQALERRETACCFGSKQGNILIWYKLWIVAIKLWLSSECNASQAIDST